MNDQNIQNSNALTLIENVDVQTIQKTLTKIAQFQGLVKQNLKQNHDFGIIPGTPKPTLLKPGAEKILMLMGITSEYELIERIQDYDGQFFAFTVKCTLLKGDQKITEGLGHCNTRERKWIKQDPCTMANTCLKMAKKRSQIDATLTVSSLSDIFTQDLEDLDLTGTSVEDSLKSSKIATDNGNTITEAQAKRLFAIAKGDTKLVKEALLRCGYTSSKDITKADYDTVCREIESDISKTT
jgi:hypothetical protein